jgi:UDP-glucose 4-epimerase
MRPGLQVPRPSHALGRMIEAQRNGTPFQVTGTSYPTRDGSGIRDYVHVWDLAAAHLAAVERFDQLIGPAGHLAINLGTGTGTTVRELLAAFASVTGEPVPSVDAPARPGDVAGACTRTERAARLLGWQPQYPVADGIRHSLQWATIRDEMLGGG